MGNRGAKGKDIEKQPIQNAPPPCNDKILKDLFYICTYLGFNDGCCSNKKTWKKIYSTLVLVLLTVASLRRILQIGKRRPGLPPISWYEAMFDPSIVIVSCQALFLFSGAMSAFMLFLIKKQFERFRKAFGYHLVKHISKEDLIKARKWNNIRLVFTVFYSTTWAILFFVHKTKFFKMPWTPPFIHDAWWMLPVEIYVVFLCQMAIMMLTNIFAHSCTILRYAIKSLRLTMTPEEMDCKFSSCPLPEESLRQIREVQSRHGDIIGAKTTLEENFTYIVFHTYSISVPLICFLGFLFFKSFNKCECWGMHFSLTIWMVTILTILMIQSLPAFLIHEEGERLLPASFKMYYETLCEDRDLLVVAQMTLLVFQIHSARLTLCAGNYFNMSRRILLSLFSAIFTYFLILVEFGDNDSGKLPLKNDSMMWDC